MKNLASTLILLVLSFLPSNAAPDSTNLSALQKRAAQLEADVEGTEAIRAVKRLQYAYGHYAEFGLWNDLAELFADKGVGHYPAGNLGKEEIRKLFLLDVGKGNLGLAEGQLYPHIMLQPVVTLDPDGKKAKGRFRVLAMLGSYGGMAIWAGGIYENEYIRENGVWKINDLHYYSRYTGRYEQAGWTADKETIPIHYDPARAGTPVPERPGTASAANLSPNLDDLSRKIADLARRAQRLNDEAAVENLQHIYGYYVDRKMWDDVADLFAADGTTEMGLQGVYVGKASIRRGLNEFGPAGLREGELNDRLQLQTIVTVLPDGYTARSRSVELAMTGVNGQGAEWGEGVYENEFIKQNGVWKIKSLRFFPRLLTDYNKGWAKDARPAPGPSINFPPDRKPTEAYGIFPKFHIVPFHFLNPVTGRATQYPKNTKYGEIRMLKPANGPAPVQSKAQLEKKISEAERLLRRAVAYDAAENLAGAYGYYLDEFMWDETADLFSVDAKRDFASISIETGRERIRESLKRRYPGKKSMDYLLVHQLVQPVIHVAQDGNSAKMRVRLFQLGGPSGGSGSWIAGVYECGTGIEDGVWKFTSMVLDYIWTADYKSGWAHIDANAKGIVAAPFPKITDVPFHYKNPVTGRKPPKLLP
jgi:hypothetical protein